MLHLRNSLVNVNMDAASQAALAADLADVAQGMETSTPSVADTASANNTTVAVPVSSSAAAATATVTSGPAQATSTNDASAAPTKTPKTSSSSSAAAAARVLPVKRQRRAARDTYVSAQRASIDAVLREDRKKDMLRELKSLRKEYDDDERDKLREKWEADVAGGLIAAPGEDDRAEWETATIPQPSGIDWPVLTRANTLAEVTVVYKRVMRWALRRDRVVEAVTTKDSNASDGDGDSHSSSSTAEAITSDESTASSASTTSTDDDDEEDDDDEDASSSSSGDEDEDEDDEDDEDEDYESSTSHHRHRKFKKHRPCACANCTRPEVMTQDSTHREPPTSRKLKF
jgi:hypothetical protein